MEIIKSEKEIEAGQVYKIPGGNSFTVTGTSVGIVQYDLKTNKGQLIQRTSSSRNAFKMIVNLYGAKRIK